MKDNKLLFQKLDFSKKFFEPILEEKEIEVIDQYSPVKTTKVPRNLPKFVINQSLGIIPFIDKEKAASPDFKNKQAQIFDTDVFF